MPDLMTHTCLGLILKKIKPDFFQRTDRLGGILLIFLLGNILPDVSGRVPIIIFPKGALFFSVYHTLAGALIIAYLISVFFERTIRKPVFFILFAGMTFHMVTDLIQKDIFGDGYKIFYPINISIDFGFLWPEDTLFFLPFLLIAVGVLYREIVLEKVRNYFIRSDK
ncbi:metal-dependent hydrolase [Elusimicrobiota bacterium]